MPDLQGRLIQAATRPLADNAELKVAAADFLKTRIAEDDAAAASMLARWDEVDARRWKSAWCIGLWVLVVVVSGGVAISSFGEISRWVPWIKWVSGGSIFTPLPEGGTRLVSDKLSEDEKLLLFGDSSKDGKSERKEALWQSEPENPAYFAEFTAAYLSEHEKLPADFLETARRIDPANAWFTYLAAAVEAKRAVKGKSGKRRKVAGKWVSVSPKTWEILDQTRLDRALDLVVEARDQPKYADYSSEMLRRRIPLLSEETYNEQIDSRVILGEATVFSSLSLRSLGEAFAAKAWSQGESGDVQGFRETSSDGERFLRVVCHENPGTLVDELINKVLVGILAESFVSVAEKLGLEGDVARWKPIEKWIVEVKERRDSREFMVDGKAVKQGTAAGGILWGSCEMVARQVETQPLVTDADLKPMRLMDHEFLAWALSYVMWLAMAAIIGLVAAYRFRVAPLSRRLARRMEDLLRPFDWGWIFAVGVVAPFIYVMAINRLTPLGGRAFGVLGMELLMPAGHFFGLLCLWLTLPLQIGRWRLRKRAGGFGFPGASWIGWLAVVCAVAFVPMIGWAAMTNVGEYWLSAGQVLTWPWQFWVAISLGGLSLLWVAGLISFAMLGRADRHLYQAASSMVLVRAFAVAMAVLALASIGFKASERDWFKQDWMSKLDPVGPGWSAFESQVAAQLRKELREVLGDERKSPKNATWLFLTL